MFSLGLPLIKSSLWHFPKCKFYHFKSFPCDKFFTFFISKRNLHRFNNNFSINQKKAFPILSCLFPSIFQKSHNITPRTFFIIFRVEFFIFFWKILFYTLSCNFFIYLGFTQDSCQVHLYRPLIWSVQLSGSSL